MKMKLLLTAIALTAASIAGSIAQAQSPAPVVVQAIIPGAAPAPRAAAPAPISDNSESTLRALQQMKAANEEVLKKQAAVLEQLDEIGKSAEQIRIYSKRG
ncbi:MAG: hypothetical protein M3Y86_08540 [Verrucomicrobiota bacterium]|nr:hypothetical protein [Verrucomicrobiota bacterium]